MGIYVCHGHIQGEFPDFALWCKIQWEDSRAGTKVDTTWASKSNNGRSARQILDTQIMEGYKTGNKCFGYKKFRATNLQQQKLGRAFQGDWIWLPRTCYIQEESKTESKAYVLLYSCSLTRVKYLTLYTT